MQPVAKKLVCQDPATSLAQWQVQSGNGAPGPVQAEGWSTSVLLQQEGGLKSSVVQPSWRLLSAELGLGQPGKSCGGSSVLWLVADCTPSHYTLMFVEFGPTSFSSSGGPSRFPQSLLSWMVSAGHPAQGLGRKLQWRSLLGSKDLVTVGLLLLLTHFLVQLLLRASHLPFQDLHPLLLNLLPGLQSLCGLQLGLMEPVSLSCQALLALGSQLLESLGVGLFQFRHLGLQLLPLPQSPIYFLMQAAQDLEQPLLLGSQHCCVLLLPQSFLLCL